MRKQTLQVPIVSQRQAVHCCLSVTFLPLARSLGQDPFYSDGSSSKEGFDSFLLSLSLTRDESRRTPSLQSRQLSQLEYRLIQSN